MNERIKLLKNLASVWCDENIPEQFSEETNGYGSAWEDKFAELIVRECLEVVERQFGGGNGDGVEWDRAVDFTYNDMKQHFGVEE
jgi:hypothetical protein